MTEVSNGGWRGEDAPAGEMCVVLTASRVLIPGWAVTKEAVKGDEGIWGHKWVKTIKQTLFVVWGRNYFYFIIII